MQSLLFELGQNWTVLTCSCYPPVHLSCVLSPWTIAFVMHPFHSFFYLGLNLEACGVRRAWGPGKLKPSIRGLASTLHTLRKRCTFFFTLTYTRVLHVHLTRARLLLSVLAGYHQCHLLSNRPSSGPSNYNQDRVVRAASLFQKIRQFCMQDCGTCCTCWMECTLF